MGYKLLGLLRIFIGWVFFWAFLDKLFGLGFNTATEDAWLAGGSPTAGFLQFATYGPLSSVYEGMAGSPVVDWLFMLGLLFVGLFLILGIMIKLAGWAGALMMILMYFSMLLPENNPFWSDHLTKALLLIIFPFFSTGDYLGLGQQWRKQEIVKKFPFLQ